ncbi:retrovirus-related pol polyprotein from transposon TNT 1-94 [Tanacetum coccineum]
MPLSKLIFAEIDASEVLQQIFLEYPFYRSRVLTMLATLDEDAIKLVVFRIKKYEELSATKKIQADCDLKATNIVFQGLPSDVYSLVNHHRVAKDLWERVQLLMQGTSLTKQERECKLYDAFDKFAHIKGESLHRYYLRFTQLINDMNIYKMKLEQFQVNTKFLNSLPPERSKFVTDVKLIRDLHTTNFDQLHTYLEQHELHANEVLNQQTHLAMFPQIDFGLAVPVFKQGDDPIDAIKKMMSFLVTIQPVQGRQSSFAAGEGHMARHCPKPKRKRDATWFRDKVLSVEAQGSGKVLNEEELEFFADPGVSKAKAVLMANLTSYRSDFLSKAPHSENTHNDMLNQTVQDTNSSAQQDAMILYVFEQLSNQVTNCNKVNKDNLIANESLSAELERYKERVKLLEERQNVDLSTREKLIMDDIIREKNAQFADFEKEINYLKQTLSEQSKEKELLTKTFNVFKNESKEKEAKNIDKEIALEKKVKELDNIVCKMGQYVQTVHMLMKPQVFYDNNLKQALGFQNPLYLKKAHQIRPMLYDGSGIAKETNVISIVDSKKTLMLEEESRSKMLLKQSDPMVLEKKVNIKPINYVELNRLSEDFGKHFFSQQELYDEQAFRLQTLHPNTDQSASLPVKIEAPRELPKVSLVNTTLKKLKYNLGQFNNVVKKRITLDALTKGEWGFEQTKAVFLKEIIPFLKTLKDIFKVFDKDLLNEEKVFVITALKNDLRKFKGKDIVDNVAQVSNATTIAPGMYKLDPVALAPKDKNNRETHIYYLKHTMEQAAILREIVEQAKSLNPLDSASYSACKYVKLIQELLGYVRDTCPDIHKPSEKLVAVTPINKKKIVSSMFDARHELCFLEFVFDMNASSKSKSVKKAKKKEEWKPTGKVITRPLRKCLLRIPLEVVAHESVVTKVYTRRPKVVQLVCWYLELDLKHMTEDRSQLTNFVHKFLGTVKFGNDQLAKIMGYGDYQIDNGTEFVNQTLRSYYESVGILSETSLPASPQLKGVVTSTHAPAPRNRTLVEAARTMLIYAKAPLFLWAEAVATACYTQNRSIIRRRHGKTPYELLHDRKPNLSYLYVFGALCYPNNDSEDLGKLQAKADIGIFIGYAPKKKAYRIYNRRTRKIIETIHVNFDELTAMASEQLGSGPGLQSMTPATSSSGLVSNPIPQQPCNPPPRDDWDRLFQPMFDEYFNPPTIVVSPVPVAAAPRAVDLADSPVSTSIDQDAPSTSIPSTQDQEHSLIIS